MLLRHVGLTCSTEENADRFYRDLLNLDKSAPKILPAELSKAIFNLEAPLPIIDYKGRNVHFEIFITGPLLSTSAPIAHQCLEIFDLSDFLEKCRTLGVEVRRVPKGDRMLTFVADFDGNLFEIKGL